MTDNRDDERNEWFDDQFVFYKDIIPLFNQFNIVYQNMNNIIAIRTRELQKVFRVNNVDGVDQIVKHVLKYFAGSIINYYFVYAGFYSGLECVLYFNTHSEKINWKNLVSDETAYFARIVARPDDNVEVVAEVHQMIMKQINTYDMVPFMINAFMWGNLKIFQYLYSEYLQLTPESARKKFFIPVHNFRQFTPCTLDYAIDYNLIDGNDLIDYIHMTISGISDELLEVIDDKINSGKLVCDKETMQKIRDKLNEKN